MIRRTVSLSLSLVVMMAIGIGFALPAHAAPVPAYSPNAFASYLKAIGGQVSSGPTAVTGLCTTLTPKQSTNSTASTQVPPGTGTIISTGTATTSSTARIIGGASESKGLSTIQNVGLLDPDGAGLLPPMISASTLVASAKATLTGGAFGLSSLGTAFTNLSVLGLPVVNPAPNTTVALPGVGTVVLNEQISSLGVDRASLTVRNIHITINDVLNPFGLNVGTQIFVGSATGALRNVSGLTGGQAYGSEVRIGGLVTSGKTALVSLGCFGSGGQTVTNSIASVSVPGLVSTGTVTSTGVGTIGPTTSSSDLTNAVEAASLANGLVTADLIRAEAHSMNDNGTKTFNSTGSEFVNLVVNGNPILNPSPNTRITIAGLATIWIYRVIQTASSIEVRMVEIVGTAGGPLAGHVIRIAVAIANSP